MVFPLAGKMKTKTWVSVIVILLALMGAFSLGLLIGETRQKWMVAQSRGPQIQGFLDQIRGGKTNEMKFVMLKSIVADYHTVHEIESHRLLFRLAHCGEPFGPLWDQHIDVTALNGEMVAIYEQSMLKFCVESPPALKSP